MSVGKLGPRSQSTGATGATGATGTGSGLVYSNTTIPAGNTVGNTTSETAFDSTYTLPANTATAGMCIRIEMEGTYSTDALLAPTIRGRLKFGGTTMVDTGALTCVVGVSNGAWKAVVTLNVFTAGASGVIEASGQAEFSTAATTSLDAIIANTSTFTSVDLTATKAITATVQWGTADTDNTITCRSFRVFVTPIQPVNTAFNPPTTVVTSSDQLLIGTSFADITGLSFAVAANKTYHFKFVILCDADATTTGIDVAVNGPASPTFICSTSLVPNSDTAPVTRWAGAYDADTALTGSNGTSTRACIIEGVLVNGANPGNLVARIKREAVGSGPNVRAGSCGFLTLLN